MINTALTYTSNSLNQFLKNKYGLNDDVVVTNKMVDSSGAIPLENQNKVVLSIVHLDQETVKPFYVRNKQTTEGNYANTASSQRYNIFLLVAPNFDDYNEALKFLTSSLQFFQINGAIDSKSYADVPEGINRLEFEFETGDGYMQMHNLWSALGAKYQPSVIYKMRLITIDTDQVSSFPSSVQQTSNSAEL